MIKQQNIFVNSYENADEENENIFMGDEIIKYFPDIVAQHFNDNPVQIYNFYSMILGNVYEYISLYRNALKKQYQSLYKKLNEYSLSQLVNMFIHNQTFANQIITAFFSFNNFLEKDELMDRRIKFIKIGNIARLKEFNPFYDHDLLVLRRREKNSQ